MFVTSAVRCGGFGAAHKNLVKQLPLIAAEFPEVKDCNYGTINVELPVGVIVAKPDHRTNPIRWDEIHHPEGEVFDLLRIKLETPPGSLPIDAWLYIAHNSDHRKTPRIHEIIAPPLTIPANARFQIAIDRTEILLPYKQSSTVVLV